jgi:Ion channel
MAKLLLLIQRSLKGIGKDVWLVRTQIVLFALAVFGFGCGYYYLTPGGDGLGQNGNALGTRNLADSIYFSLVTITSLGYGDFHPVGWSKALAAVEVLFGLVLMGITLAKLTSSRLSFHVTELYGAEQERKLDALAAKYERINEELQEVLDKFSLAIAPVSGESAKSSAFPATKFKSTLMRMGSVTLEVRELVLRGAQGALLKIAAGDTLIRTSAALNQGAYILSQTLTTLSGSKKTATLDAPTRTDINQIASRLEDLCNHVERESDNPEVKSQFVQIREGCTVMRRAIYESKETLQPEQPDQRLPAQPSPTPGHGA